MPIKEINYSVADYQKFENILIKINKFTQNNNAELHFFICHQYMVSKITNFENVRKNIKKIVKKNNIKFIDIHSEFFFKKENPLNYFGFTTNSLHS